MAASADNVNNGEFLILTFKVLDSTEGFTDVSVQYSYGRYLQLQHKGRQTL